MSNIADPSVFINYISEYKKIFVTSSGAPISQMFKIDSEIDDFYYFKIINSRNQTVSLHNRSFLIYGSYIDSRNRQHILFHNSSYGIEDNVLIFQINTYTDKYLEYVTNNKTINITIVETTNPITQVILRDKALAYPRPYIDGKTIQQIVEYEILTGITVPVDGSFGAGYNINLAPHVYSYAFGTGLITSNENQLVVGNFNVSDAEQAFIVGNGLSDSNRNNLFTISYDGTAYLSGNRLLTNLDRVNVSELNNDVGYITLADVPVYSAGTGLKLNGTTFSLTAEIPSSITQFDDAKWLIKTLIDLNSISARFYDSSPNGSRWKIGVDYEVLHSNGGFAYTTEIPTSISQLTNDTGFITGYTAGSGISIENGVISCTGGGGGGATYTAGEGIGISDQNVISLTATIPVVPTNISYFTNDAGYITNAALTNYALKSLIPLSTSQLTNDTGLLSSLNVYDSSDNLFLGKKLKFGSEFTIYSPLQDTIEIDPNDMLYIYVTVGSESLGYQRSLTFSDDFTYNYGYGTIELNQSANQQKVLVDNTVQGSGFVLGYNKDYDIFYNKISTNNGLLTLNVISGFENDIEVGKVATFEHWIKPEGSLTGVSLGSDLNLVGELPSSYSTNNTQVFTRRVIRLNSLTTVQQISYAYLFLEPQTPLTFKAVSGATEVALVKGGNPYPVTLEYSVNKGSWSSYTIGDTINLASGDIVSFRGNNDHFNVDDDNRYTFTFNNRVEGYGNVQSLLGFDKTTFDDGVFASLFNGCTNLLVAPNVFTTGTAGSNCMTIMFWGCSNLKKGPIIGDVYLSGSSAMNRMFRDCTSLTAVLLKFNSWGADDYSNSYAWIMDADNPTSYSSGGLIIIPQGFSYSRGNYAGMPESYNWIILNRIDGQLYYAENEDGHSQGDLFTGTDPFAE